MKTLRALFLMIVAFASFHPQAGVNGGGNGGSSVKAQMVVAKNEIQSILGKIENFSIQNEETMKEHFPEVNYSELLDMLSSLQFKVVEGKLFDKMGVSRTCLNFPDKEEIVCNLDFLDTEDQVSKYVLIFHEVLGLLGVEEDAEKECFVSKCNLKGYQISKRISSFISEGVSRYNFIEVKKDIYGKDKYLTLAFDWLDNAIEKAKFCQFELDKTVVIPAGTQSLSFIDGVVTLEFQGVEKDLILEKGMAFKMELLPGEKNWDRTYLTKDQNLTSVSMRSAGLWYLWSFNNNIARENFPLAIRCYQEEEEYLAY